MNPTSITFDGDPEIDPRQDLELPGLQLELAGRYARSRLIWLPDEPYAFGAADVEELSALEIPAARAARIHLIDGTWVSWYGPRIRQAIQALGELLSSAVSETG